MGSGHSDVLPVGINTKIGDLEIGIKARGSQIESYFPKNTNIKLLIHVMKQRSILLEHSRI